MAIEVEYLTEDDYAQAAAIGVSRPNAYARFYNYGWSKEKTITTPPVRNNLWERYKDLAEQHGISKSTFYCRVYNSNTKWDPEKAATQPMNLRQRQAGKGNSPLKKWRDVAESNGISYPAFRNRIKNLFWDPEKAATTPINEKHRRKS